MATAFPPTVYVLLQRAGDVDVLGVFTSLDAAQRGWADAMVNDEVRRLPSGQRAAILEMRPDMIDPAARVWWFEGSGPWRARDP